MRIDDASKQGLVSCDETVAPQRLGFFVSKPSIPLGLVFSQSGPYTMMAGEMRKSALMAVDEINKAGGVLGGRPIAIAAHARKAAVVRRFVTCIF